MKPGEAAGNEWAASVPFRIREVGQKHMYAQRVCRGVGRACVCLGSQAANLALQKEQAPQLPLTFGRDLQEHESK
jgi:hypothetical protein